jgi:hypothetical protein
MTGWLLIACVFILFLEYFLVIGYLIDAFWEGRKEAKQRQLRQVMDEEYEAMELSRF